MKLFALKSLRLGIIFLVIGLLGTLRYAQGAPTSGGDSSPYNWLSSQNRDFLSGSSNQQTSGCKNGQCPISAPSGSHSIKTCSNGSCPKQKCSGGSCSSGGIAGVSNPLGSLGSGMGGLGQFLGGLGPQMIQTLLTTLIQSLITQGLSQNQGQPNQLVPPVITLVATPTVAPTPTLSGPSNDSGNGLAEYAL